MSRYIVATTRPWNIAAFRRRTPQIPGEWSLVQDPAELTPLLVSRLRPRYVFFPHWSWRVPEDVLAAAECVCFHMTDVPYGRGGSPLQNLIVRGHTETKLSALRMVAELDAGPVYLKRPLSLQGSARQIFERAADLVYDMIAEINATQPQPKDQEGMVTVFPRRLPDQSRLPREGGLQSIHDHIRMLDAEGYPAAFLDHGEFRLEFASAQLVDDEVVAEVRIRRVGRTS